MATRRNRGIGRAWILAAALVAALSGQAFAYSGNLTGVGINGSGNWALGGTMVLDWTVDQNQDGTWHYAYQFVHPSGETSHFLLETSANFTLQDIFNASGDFGNIELGTWTPTDQGNSNPNMPGPLFGLKFEDASGLTTNIMFDSFRAPTWGDFYSKDGQAGGLGANAAWNAGFTPNDVDPTAPAGNGSVDFHLLVPDTQVNPIPEPGSMLLLGMGLCAGAFALKRKRAA